MTSLPSDTDAYYIKMHDCVIVEVSGPELTAIGRYMRIDGDTWFAQRMPDDPYSTEPFKWVQCNAVTSNKLDRMLRLKALAEIARLRDDKQVP